MEDNPPHAETETWEDPVEVFVPEDDSEAWEDPVEEFVAEEDNSDKELNATIMEQNNPPHAETEGNCKFLASLLEMYEEIGGHDMNEEECPSCQTAQEKEEVFQRKVDESNPTSIEHAEDQDEDSQEMSVTGHRTPQSQSLPLSNFRPHMSKVNFLHHHGEDKYLYKISQEVDFIPYSCLKSQPEIKADTRTKMVRMLIEKQAKYKLRFGSLCLAVNIMDRVLKTTSIRKKKVKLLARSCLLLASQHLENDLLRVSKLRAHFVARCGYKRLERMRSIVLKSNQSIFPSPTAEYFMEHYVLELLNGSEPTQVDMELVSGAQAIAKLCMKNYDYCWCPASILAHCSLVAAETCLLTKPSRIPGMAAYHERVVQQWRNKTLNLVWNNMNYCLPSKK